MTEPTTDAAPSGNVYQGALALLEEYGWVPGTNQDEQGRICLGEAIARTVRNSDGPDAASVPDAAVSVALGRFADRLRTAGIITQSYARSVVGWNDEGGRTYEEIQNALNVASAQCVAEGVTY